LALVFLFFLVTGFVKERSELKPDNTSYLNLNKNRLEIVS